MKRSKRRNARRALGLWLLVGSLTSLAVSADYRASFKQGIVDFENRRWVRAENHFLEAIAEQPKAGGKAIRIYGASSNKLYHPYYFLGLTRFERGDHLGAIDALEDSIDQGEVFQMPANRPYYYLALASDAVANSTASRKYARRSVDQGEKLRGREKERLDGLLAGAGDVSPPPPPRPVVDPDPPPPLRVADPGPPPPAPVAAPDPPPPPLEEIILVPLEPVAPDRLVSGATAYFEGRYSQVVADLGPGADFSSWTRKAIQHGWLFVAAAEFSLSRQVDSSTTEGQGLLEKARAAIRECLKLDLDGNFSPSELYFSPTFVAEFARLSE